MKIEILSSENLCSLTFLALALWPGSTFEEEFENFSSILALENEICYLVKENETCVAFIHLSIRFDYVEGASDSPVGYIEALFVKPEYQKLGIGKKLVKAGEVWCKQKGIKQLASDTELNNIESINFHHKIGFEEVNRIVCFIKEI